MDIGKLPRGEDFANKFAKGEWAEIVLIETINDDTDLFAFQYGISRGDALDTKAQLDAVKEPGVNETKRPDVLVFTRENFESLHDSEQDLIREFIAADPDRQGQLLPELEKQQIIDSAIMALEAESSNFNLSKRKYGNSLTAYVKDEDLPRLNSWHDKFEVPIFVCQLFFDRGYIIPFEAYSYYAEDARQGDADVPGFEHGMIPNIQKKGLQAKVEEFPFSKLLGRFSESPDVVQSSSDGPQQCRYEWTKSGKLSVPGAGYFANGNFELEKALREYL